MELTATQASFDEIKNVWNHYWSKEIIKRPPVIASVPQTPECKARSKEYHSHRYALAVKGEHDTSLDFITRMVEETTWLGEGIPFFGPDYGPDQFATFFGTDLTYSEDSPNTNWAVPVIKDWKDFLPMRFDHESKTWKGLLSLARLLSENGRGKFLVGICDLHSNVDTLAALRGPQQLCLDFIDCPDMIEEAMGQVRPYFAYVYNELFTASGCDAETGSIGWTPFWCDGKMGTIQADFICMVSPEISRKYIIPALKEEADFLDHCVYHLDGPGALAHLDDILAIKGIDVIQWVSGAGQPPMYEWTDVLKKCQKAGKGLQLYGIDNIEIVKKLHKELRPEGLAYCLSGQNIDEVRETMEWLEQNT